MRIQSQVLLLLILLVSAFVQGASLTLKCPTGIEIEGVGSPYVILKFGEPQIHWGDIPLVNPAKNNDCKKASHYLCYNDDKAMINIPLSLVSGFRNSGKVYITTDIGDEVPGTAYECIVH